MGFTMIALSLLAELKATVWRRVRVPDRESFSGVLAGVAYFSAASARPSRAAWAAATLRVGASSLASTAET
jgi:hypothetical protein